MAMPTLPTHNTVAPSVASTFPNGGPVPAHLLRDPGDGLGRLLVLPSLGMQALHLLGAEQGYHVETTGRGRSLAVQTSTFLQRYTPNYSQLVNSTGDQRVCVLDQRSIHPDLYPGKRWYKRKGVAAAAAPGTSPHGKWVADDLSQEYDGDPETDPVTEAFIRWLVPIAASLGFAWSLQSEPWHVQWIAGDRLPPLVVSTLNRYNIPIPGFPPPDPNPPAEAPPMATLSESVLLLDTRDPAGGGAKVPGGTDRLFLVSGDRPSWARAVEITLTVNDTEGDGGGFVIAWNGNGNWDDNPNRRGDVNWWGPGQTHTNTIKIPLGGNEGHTFRIFASAATHLVVELIGYDSVI